MQRSFPAVLLTLCALLACTSSNKEQLLIGTWEVQMAQRPGRHTLIHFDADHRMRSETRHGEKRTFGDTSTFVLSADGRNLDFSHRDIPGGTLRAAVLKLTADTLQFTSPEGDTVLMTRYSEGAE